MGVQPAKVEPRWLAAGPPYEFTRGELLEALRIMGHPMTERRLRTWADRDLLPPPSRRAVPPGATDGVVRALYPAWTIPVLEQLLHESQHNKTIAELQEVAPKASALWASVAQEKGDLGLLASFGLVIEIDGRPSATDEANYPARAKLTGPPRITRALQRAAWDYAADFADKYNKPVKRLRITIEGEDGVYSTLRIPAPPPPQARKNRDR